MANSPDEPFQVVNSSEAASAFQQTVDLEPDEDDVATKVSEPIVEDRSSQQEEVEMEDDGCYLPLLSKEVLSQFTEVNAHGPQVEWSSLAMAYIESEGQKKQVPKELIPNEVKDEQRALWDIASTTIFRMNRRIKALEEEVNTLKKGASSSSSSAAACQPMHVDKDWENWATASASEDWSCESAKKVRMVPASVDSYTPPTWQPWTVTQGICRRCNKAWSNNDVQKRENGRMNESMDRAVWETIMKQMYLDWSPEKIANGEKLRVLDSYTHAAANITNSLNSAKVVQQSHYDEVEGKLRSKFWKPDCHNDDRCMWMYFGGKKDKKYLTFGCIHCQRCTTVYYSAKDLQQVLQRFFW